MDNQYFRDKEFKIPQDSPLIKALRITPGTYQARWHHSSGILYLRKHRGHKNTEIEVTFEELKVILMLAQSQHDKFTPEDIETINNIGRKKSPKVKTDHQSHHIIPMEVCKKSKLVVKAIQYGFDEDAQPNRLALPITFHKGSHPRYSKFVLEILEDEWSLLVNEHRENDREQILETVSGAIDYFRERLQDMSRKGQCTINNMFEMY